MLYKHNTNGEPLNGYFLTAPGDYRGAGSEEVVFENNNELWMREHILVTPGVVDVIDWIFLPEVAAAGARAAEDGDASGLSFGPAQKVGETTVSRG